MVIISNESFGKQPGQHCQIQLYFIKFGTSEYLFCSRLDNRVQLYYRDIKLTSLELLDLSFWRVTHHYFS